MAVGWWGGLQSGTPLDPYNRKSACGPLTTHSTSSSYVRLHFQKKYVGDVDFHVILKNLRLQSAEPSVWPLTSTTRPSLNSSFTIQQL